MTAFNARKLYFRGFRALIMYFLQLI